MEALGWGPYQADHEDGNGQFEINWEFDNALVTADRHAFAKYMTKSIAEKHGYVASVRTPPHPATHPAPRSWSSLGLAPAPARGFSAPPLG